MLVLNTLLNAASAGHTHTLSELHAASSTHMHSVSDISGLSDIIMDINSTILNLGGNTGEGDNAIGFDITPLTTSNYPEPSTWTSNNNL